MAATVPPSSNPVSPILSETLPDSIFCDRRSSISDSDVPRNDSFVLLSNQLTRDYVSSNVANPSQTLGSPKTRSDFVIAVFGDTSLAKHAENDLPLLRQLEARAVVLLHQSLPLLTSPPPSHHHLDADAIVAVLALVAAHWPILVDAMEQKGAILAIVTTMRRFASIAPLVARCMTALHAFSVTDAVRKRVMVDGGLSLTLDLMARYRSDRRVQLRATAVVANVSFGCTHRKRRIAREGAVRRIIDGMHAFPSNDAIHLRGALAIRNLTHEAQVNQYIAGNEGAVEVIATSLLRFRKATSLSQLRFQCVMALEALCREDERNRQRVIDVDHTGTSFTNSMSTDSVGVSKRSDDDPERVNEDGDIVVEEEEILLPNASTNFRHGGALFPGRDGKQLDTCTSLSSSGCSERLPAPVKPPTSPVLTDDGHDVLNGERRPSLIRAIVHTIRRDPDDDLLVESAISLLTLISMNRSDVQLRIGEVGGVQVAIASMRRHSKNAAIVSKAGALVRALCFQDANRSHVSSGLVVLIAAARDHCRDAETAREVVSALSNCIFEHEKNRAWVVNKGGVEAVVKVMNEGSGKDVMVLEAGICALRNFVESNESGALSAANEGAIRAAVNALDMTKECNAVGQRFVQEQCVLFLADLERLAGSTKDEMLEVDAADWIENALAKLPTEEFKEAHTNGDKLLAKLSHASGEKFSGAKPGKQKEMPPSPTTITGRGFPRGLFGVFTSGRKSAHRSAIQSKSAQSKTVQPKVVVSFPGEVSGGATTPGVKRNTRKSGRLRRRTAVYS